jgi:hypothetical protein
LWKTGRQKHIAILFARISGKTWIVDNHRIWIHVKYRMHMELPTQFCFNLIEIKQKQNKNQRRISVWAQDQVEGLRRAHSSALSEPGKLPKYLFSSISSLILKTFWKYYTRSLSLFTSVHL